MTNRKSLSPTPPTPPTQLTPLLQPRKVTAQQLGVSVGSVIRYEQQGIITKVKLTKRGKVLHRVAQVRALAGNRV